MNFAAFEAAARAQGYDEVLERRWAPRTVLAAHKHPFAVRALVVQGEMWLECRNESRHLVAGDEFTLDHGVPHAERYGAEAATNWVALRTAGT